MKRDKLPRLSRIGINIKNCCVLALLFLVLMLTSCGKTSLDEKLFTEIVEKNKFVVADITSTDYSKPKTLLAVGDHYQIYYYQFGSESKCNKEYKLLKEKLNNTNGNINDVKKSKKGYEYYRVENNNIYSIVYKVSNSYIYVNTTVNYKDEVDDLFKQFGLK